VGENDAGCEACGLVAMYSIMFQIGVKLDRWIIGHVGSCLHMKLPLYSQSKYAAVVACCDRLSHSQDVFVRTNSNHYIACSILQVSWNPVGRLNRSSSAPSSNIFFPPETSIIVLPSTGGSEEALRT
jgi:hypothetical protein